MKRFRSEQDSFGTIDVPSDHLWGAQTQRSLIQFNISTEKMPTEFIWALALVKKACILTNLQLGQLPQKKATPLLEATQEVLSGVHYQEFPLSVWQTGSATQTNMNMNEVLANRAILLMGGILGEDYFIHPKHLGGN